MHRKMSCLLLFLVVLLLSLNPGVVLAGPYSIIGGKKILLGEGPGGVPPGDTLLAWGVGTASINVDTHKSFAGISFMYNNGFSTDIGLNVPLDPSWHKLDDVRPILEAAKEGWGAELGGISGIVGTDIKFAPNVLAAMKVQNFNPSHVGGANIPPSSTTLNSSEIAWLKQPGIGYAGDLASLTASKPVSSQASSSPAPKTQTQSKPSTQQTPSTQPTTSGSSAQKTTPATSSSAQSDPVQKDPSVGKTVKTPSGQVTSQMIVADQKAIAKHPPSLNPKNVPIKIPVTPKKNTSSLAKMLKNEWAWAGAGVVVLILLAIAGRVIYVRRRTA